MEDEGVKARYGTSKKYGEYISYELVDVPPHIEGADREYKARSYTLGDSYGVEALREKLREKYKDFFRFSEQRNNDLPGASQDGLNTEAAALLPVNRTPEMKCVPEVKQKSVGMVSDIVNTVLSGPRREASAETPIPVQPAPTTPPTAAERAEGTDSTPEGKQPVQSATAPQKGKLNVFNEMQRIIKQVDEKAAQKQLENQQDDMEWVPRR